ncbi:MAG: single-stranded DNA-binding protein [Chloroflexi bacterium]|nr:single-stranded DNA-binding protein [Chloroflexota bacterium]
MQNNWVLLQGRLCHTPNYTSTKKGLHKVAFRLAVPRPPRSAAGTPASPMPTEDLEHTAILRLSSGHDADYVTVIIIGKPAWEFKQLDLKEGAAVRVQGRLRSWDIPADSDSESPASEMETAPPTPRHVPRRDYRLEVIAEKVDPLAEQRHEK